MPSTPSEAPTPMPALTPVDNPSCLGLFIIVVVGNSCSFEELDVEVRYEAAVGFTDELDNIVEVARAKLYPTTAMAPTLEEADNVVVAVDQSSEAPSEVEA